MGLLDDLKHHFDGRGWEYEPLPTGTAVRLRYQGHAAEWSCFAQAREAQQQMVFYSRASFQVPPERRAAVAEFVARANYGMIMGNFELDLDDGEVRFKTSLDVEGAVISDQTIRNLIGSNLTMMDKYIGGIMGVAFGGKHPKEAVAEIEKA